MQSLTELERSQWEKSQLDSKGRFNVKTSHLIKPSLITLVVVNSEGLRELSDSDAELLCKMDSRIVNELYEACAKWAGISDTDNEAILKNLPETGDDGHS
jgi:hypothetical protein